MKPTVLIFAHYYLPGTRAGGPIRSISNLVNNFNDNYIFKIITSDRDYGDKFSYIKIEKNKWTTVGNASVYYLSPSVINLITMVNLIRSSGCDFYYLNSFFDPKFSFWPLFLRWAGFIHNKPLLIAPRGEFSPSALSIKSFKKRIYLKFLKFFNLLKDVVWQASSNFEKTDILSCLYVEHVSKDLKVTPWEKVKVAPDLLETHEKIFISNNLLTKTNINTKTKTKTKPNTITSKKLNICFASRISRMKNLDFLLKILSKVRADVILNIHGPAEDLDYWIECKKIIDLLPKNVQVNIFGPYKNEDVELIFGENDLLFLPTQGENFGHVIFEALKCGVPVLISDRTPWVGLENSKAGWVGSLEESDYFVKAIEKLAKMDISELNDYKNGARDYAQNYLRNNSAHSDTEELFRYLLN